MRVALTSDLHGNLPDIEPCDVLVIAGDICPDRFYADRSYRNSPDRNAQARWLDGAFREWLKTVPADEVVAIAGNHDFVFEHVSLVPDLPWHYLHNESVEIDGVTFYGTPYVPRLSPWAFYAADGDLYKMARSIPNNVDVLITHGPPHGYGDRVLSGEEVGNRGLTSELLRIDPTLVVTGHIHEAYGEYNLRHIPICNVSLCTRWYDPTNPVVYKEI